MSSLPKAKDPVAAFRDLINSFYNWDQRQVSTDQHSVFNNNDNQKLGLYHWQRPVGFGLVFYWAKSQLMHFAHTWKNRPLSEYAAQRPQRGSWGRCAAYLAVYTAAKPFRQWNVVLYNTARYTVLTPSGKEKENQHVNPCVNLTTVAGKSHLRLKSGLTLLELQVTANSSPSLRMTWPLWESVTAGGSSGTGWKDWKQPYCCWWLIVITKLFCMGPCAKQSLLHYVYWQGGNVPTVDIWGLGLPAGFIWA